MCFEKFLNATRPNENNFFGWKTEMKNRRERQAKPNNLFECHRFMDFKLMYCVLCHFTFVPINYVFKCYKYQLQRWYEPLMTWGEPSATTLHLLNFYEMKTRKKETFHLKIFTPIGSTLVSSAFADRKTNNV